LSDRRNGPKAFQHYGHDRTGRHELRQTGEKRSFAMNLVETLRLAPLQPDHLQRADCQPRRLETPDDVPNVAPTDRVRLHHHQRALDHAVSLSSCRSLSKKERARPIA
jgi:hypothetical protein